MVRQSARIIIGGFVLCGVALSGHVLNHISGAPPWSTNSFRGEEFSWGTVQPRKELHWESCYSGRQCARLIVPLNYTDPQGQEATIALIRKPAIISPDSKFYRGPVLFNPGGPGGSGVDLLRGPNSDLFSLILGPQFDIVSFDLRGIARSTPRASFFKTDVERELWGGETFGIVNNSDEGIARTWARSKVVGQLAAEQDYGYLRHINTDQTARDMLSIVEAHGRSKIQYWGFSYGSVLGAAFASMFPDKIERLVIDGVVDSENYYATLWSNNLLDTDKVMESFYTGCADAGPYLCPFWASSPDDIERNLTALYDSLRSRPLPVKTGASYGIFDYGFLRSIVFSALYNPYSSFPVLARGLAELAAGNPQQLFERVVPPPFECSCDSPERAFASVRDSQAAVLCNDGNDVPEDLKSTEEYFEMLTKASSWSEIWARIRVGCIGWPKFPKDHFQGPFEGNTSHPILLVGNTADPVTPLWAAKKMSRGFPGSVVLTQDSAGHCSISGPSICTQRYIRNYFVHGVLPKPDTVCNVIGKPFPHPELETVSEGSQSVLADLSQEDRELFTAIQELSKTHVIPRPHTLGTGWVANQRSLTLEGMLRFSGVIS
ncbi:hypothetical protein M413DRAFT_444393 [Hebeloma cylindrosporum]|uniref:AB hydrolase-1 domain-containing protein n=1 Tax=Hebeloma cylindrosporum TaxID=76867 RepID=A0A0C2YNX1_HEBCY|nr:hypothetical protein M413DRAFT_444393 [Hebeloma cylindrosporum h7]